MKLSEKMFFFICVDMAILKIYIEYLQDVCYFTLMCICEKAQKCNYGMFLSERCFM